MAQSDNVIRAGFTPKFKDKSALVSSLTYKCIPISGLVLQPEREGSERYTELYHPPVEEFCVEKIQLDDVEIGSKVTLEGKSSGSILILIAGSMKVENTHQQVVQGSVHFIPASLTIHCLNGTTHLLAFRAFVYT